MDSQSFNELSNELNALVTLIKSLDNLHMYRYQHFVKSSPLGRSCTYAKKSLQLSIMDNEGNKIRADLERAKQLIDHLLRTL